MKKIKVLQVLGSLNMGGVENVAMNYIRYIDREKYQIDFLILSDGVGYFESEAKKLGSKIYKINPPTKSITSYLRDLFSILQSENYDVIHSHTSMNSGLNMLVSYFCGVKIRISHSHTDRRNRETVIFKKIYNYSMRLLLNVFSTHHLACSKDAGQYLFGTFIFNKKGIIMKNAINLDRYKYCQKMRDRKKKELGLKNEKIMIQIGRLVEVKNHSFSIDVFTELLKLDNNYKFLIVGDGPLKSELSNSVISSNAKDHIIFLGNREDIAELLMVSDIMILPSHYEGLGLVLIEAQASGLPCLASSNVPSSVKINNNFKFLDLDVSGNEWLSYIIKLSHEKRETNQYKLMQEGYDIKDMIEEISRIYCPEKIGM